MRGSLLDQVRSLIERLAPVAICDDCIAERLKLSSRQEARRKAREIAGTQGFERHIGNCALCGSRKTVIHNKGRT